MVRSLWLAYLVTRAALFALVYTGQRFTLFGIEWWPGSINIILYGYFAEVVERGGDPYTLPGGPIDPNAADYPPTLMAAFGLAGEVFPFRVGALLVCFAGELALFAATMALAKRRNGLDAVVTAVLVLANPYWIAAELYSTQYKAWIAAGLVAFALVRSPIVSGALAGVFVVPAVLVPMQYREDRNWRAVVVACGVAVLCWVPHFPEAWVATSARRAARYAMTPRSGSLAAAVPEAVWPWCMVGLALAAAAFLLVLGNTLLRACMAMALITMLSPEVPQNRILPFILPIMIVAPMTGKQRLACLGLWWVGYAGHALRWAPPYEESLTFPVWLWLAQQVPHFACAVIAWRASASSEPSLV